jgi:hypothetical protein
VQGMSYLAGCLLLHLETEFETFKAFANLMNKEESLFNFYSFSMDKVNVVYHIFMRILKEKAPKLCKILQDTGLSCSVFLFEWIVCLFSNVFPLDMASRIWDSIFLDGEFFVIKTGIAICVGLERAAGSDSVEGVVIRVKNVKSFLEEE